MERDLPSGPTDDDPQRPTTDEAAELLSTLGSDRSRLADQIPTPWWYHTTLGLIVVAFVLAQVLPAVLSISLVVVGILALPVLTTAYTRRYGVSLAQPTGKHSGRLLLGAVGVVAVAMIGSLLIRFSHASPWLVIPLAAAAFVATVVLGRRYDDALRRELTEDQ